MAIPLKVLIEREYEFNEERTIGTVNVSRSGGPVRTIITGREPHPTGRFVCVKSAFKGTPAESIKAEFPAIFLLEVGSPIHSFLAQPHRLDMRVEGKSRALTYFPDFDSLVDRRFADDLANKHPFAETLMRWKPSAARPELCRLVIEVKDDGDPRLNDQEYLDKLKLAGEFYGRVGWRFITVVRSRDLQDSVISPNVREIFLDALTRITTVDVALVAKVIGEAGQAAPYETVAAALGAGPLGRAKLAALHVRRVVSINLAKPLGPDSEVRLVDDGGAILPRKG